MTIDLLDLIPATALLQRLPIPAVVVDALGQIALVNAALSRMVDQSRNALEGHSVEVLAPGLLGQHVDVIKRLKALTDRVITLTDNEGRRRYARVNAALSLGQDEDFAVVLFEDVEEPR